MIRIPLLVLLIGVLGGLAGVGLHFLLSVAITVLYGSNDVVSALGMYPWWLVVVLPALGGLFVGLLMRYTQTPEIAGEGVPAILVALEHDQSVVRYRIPLLKTLATVATISTGGSAGREGPIIQIGAALGSLVAQWQKVDVVWRETLLLAGAASAMAATFGTPVAALLFVTEVLRRQMTILRVIAITVAVVAGMVVAQGIFSYQGLPVPVPSVITFDSVAMVLAAIVGVVSGIVAVIFAYVLRTARQISIRTITRPWLRPAVGGLLVGGLLVWLPVLHEAASYQLGVTITEGVSVSIWLLLIILVTKVCATAITVGTGGSGGIFTPSLLIGVLVGAIVQNLAGWFGVQISAQLLLVGMAAVFAGAAHAPVTAVFMVYELSEATTLIPSLIIATLLAYATARAISAQHVYSVHT